MKKYIVKRVRTLFYYVTKKTNSLFSCSNLLDYIIIINELIDSKSRLSIKFDKKKIFFLNKYQNKLYKMITITIIIK